MLVTFDQASECLSTGKLFHVAATASLLRRLPKGNWFGGSTEYFTGKGGGEVTDQLVSVMEIPCESYKIVTYDSENISSMGKDAYPNGFTILILPFDSDIHRQYAEQAADFDDIFLNPVIGWVAGYHLDKPNGQAVSANGIQGEIFTDKAVALHASLPADKSAMLNMVNIFEPNLDGPSIMFPKGGFVADSCLIDGKEANFADYIARNGLNTQLPLVGDYSGADVNISIKEIVDGKVHFYAPLSEDVCYRFAKNVENYADAFRNKLDGIQNKESVFTCNCVLNFQYGELEHKDFGTLYGPVTFGEIAWQLINQTLVYLQVE
jgi:hypothetical protein